VQVDDVTIGALRRRQTRTFEVEPGERRLGLKIDWRGSRRIRLDLREGDQAVFVCRHAPALGKTEPKRRHEYIVLDLVREP
jgi:hypothetical protein